jgi:L-threonylcarbamoyladenylate synthase
MEILKVNPIRENFSNGARPKNLDKIIKKVIKFIKQGKVIVSPTDTVYGLICDATNKKAVEKLFKIKKRKPRKPIPIFIKDIKTAKRLAFINKNQENFLAKAWPGKITVVLKRRKGKKLYGVDKKTIGLRIPNYRFLNILLKKLNRPLTGTSANVSGKSPSGKIKEVLKQFENQKIKPDLILDKGNLKPSKPSTLIDLTGSKMKILRKGSGKIIFKK